jgi:hypothetical protein
MAESPGTEAELQAIRERKQQTLHKQQQGRQKHEGRQQQQEYKQQQAEVTVGKFLQFFESQKLHFLSLFR